MLEILKIVAIATFVVGSLVFSGATTINTGKKYETPVINAVDEEKTVEPTYSAAKHEIKIDAEESKNTMVQGKILNTQVVLENTVSAGTWKTTYDIIFEDIYDHSSKKDYSHIEDFDTITLNRKEFYIFQNENSTDANLIYDFDDNSYLLIRVIGREKALYNNVGTKIEEDEALVDSNVLNTSKMLKILDFKIIK